MDGHSDRYEYLKQYNIDHPEVQQKWRERNREFLKQVSKKRYRKIRSIVKEKSSKLRKIFTDMLGGKCSICGYDKCLEAIDFHHIDPSTKTIGVCTMIHRGKSFEIIEKEVEKCVLLCKNCHTELHNKERKLKL